MPRSLCLLIFLVAFMLLSLPGLSASQRQDPPHEVVSVAAEGLPAFLQAIPPGEITHFNFISPRELEQATLGVPFQIHTIDPRDILKHDGHSPVADLVRPTDVWLVPVVVDDRFRTLLTVDRIDGVWRAVSIGASGLAEEWEALENTYPKQQGYELTFVRVYQAVSDFVLLDQPRHEDAMIPMRSASMVLGMPRGEALAPSSVIEDLRETVRMNLELDRAYQ